MGPLYQDERGDVLLRAHSRCALDNHQAQRPERARLSCLRHFFSNLDYPDKNKNVTKSFDPLLVSQADAVVRKGEPTLGKSKHSDQRI